MQHDYVSRQKSHLTIDHAHDDRDGVHHAHRRCCDHQHARDAFRGRGRVRARLVFVLFVVMSFSVKESSRQIASLHESRPCLQGR